MTRQTPPEDFDDLERELAALAPKELSAELRARLLAIPERTKRPLQWSPSRRHTRTAVALWAAAAAIGLYFGSSGTFSDDEARSGQVVLVNDDEQDADDALDLLAELSLPDEASEEP